MDIVEAIGQVVEGRSLGREDAETVMEAVLSGRATPGQIAALLTSLRMKGETVEELIGFARVVRARATPVPVRSDGLASGADRESLLDTCGTGGDASGTFNISTATAFVVAGAGIRVAKHGNRSISSACGSADVVEALGIRIDLPPEDVARCIEEVGLGFLYAPMLHGALRHVMPVRRELKFRTVFNLLGPLCNPAGASAQVLGVFDEGLTEVLAEVLCQLGCRRALVVHGSDGLDELTITGPSKISEVQEGRVRTYHLSPEDLGLQRAAIETLRGGGAEVNAGIIRGILAGEQGSRREVVVLNAAAGLVAAGKAQDFQEGIDGATRSITSGTALRCLEDLIALSGRLGSKLQAKN